MARPIKVFVTYSRHGDEAQRVKALCKWLQQISGDRLNFILDDGLRKSNDVFEFEKTLANYRACLVMGTRKYKEKVMDKKFGVGREFQILLSAMEARSLRVFTVITEADFESVFPEALKGPLATNFSGISYNPTYNEISRASVSQFQAEAKSLVDDILSTVATASSQSVDIDKIRQKLIFEQKHELMSTNVDDETLKQIFVKTSYFHAVKRKSSYLLVGRKGSGKSFLTDYFLRFPDQHPTVNILLHLRNFRLITLYTMGTRARLKKDLNVLISQADVFECAWGIIFTVGCIAQTYLDVLSGRFDAELSELFEIRSFLDNSQLIDDDFNGDGPTLNVQRLIDWSTEKVHHILEAGIDSLSGEYAQSISKIQSFVDTRRVIPAIIGTVVKNEFSAFVSKYKPSYFFAIDGFDSKFDNFRRETHMLAFSAEAQAERVQFEIDWLRGLVEASFNLVSPASGAETGFRGAGYSLLVTLPRDRFIELQRFDRDGFRLRHKYVDIEWSALELMNLVRKRLEHYYDKMSDTKGDIFDRLDESLKWIGIIPTSLDFKYNDENVRIGLFNYMLRHSFWRPRDLIYHISLFIDRGDKNRKIGRKITLDNVREIVKNASNEIIEKEFIGEFVSILPKIEEIITRFSKQKNILDFGEIYELINECDFMLGSGEMIFDSIGKIDFLYEIGFLGVICDTDVTKGIGFLRAECFSFSDPIDIYRKLSSKDKRILRWVIHPIFSEYLRLDRSSSNFVLNYERDYLISRD